MRAALALALGIALLVAIPHAEAAPPAPFEIDAILSLTGTASYLGHENATGLAMVENAVDAAGGVRGRPIRFVVEDDESSPQIAVQLLSRLLQKTPKPAVVIGSSVVASCRAMAPLVERTGPVLYCLSAGYYPTSGSYAFAYGIPTSGLLRVMIRYFRARGWHDIAAMFTTDATGQDGEKAFSGALALPENADMHLVALEHYAASDVSATAQLSRIKASGARALIVWATGTPLGTVLHAATDLGLNVPFGVPGSNLNYAEMAQFATILPRELYLVSVPGLAPDALPPGPLKRAVGAYVDAVRANGQEGDANYVNGWDPGTIVVNALKALGLDASASRIQAYLEGLHGWYGAGGEYDFRDGSQRGLNGATTAVVRWDATRKTFVAVSRLGGDPVPGR